MFDLLIGTSALSIMLMSSRADENEDVKALAADLGRTPVSILLSWAVQRGTVVLPKSVTPARIKSNLEGMLSKNRNP